MLAPRNGYYSLFRSLLVARVSHLRDYRWLALALLITAAFSLSQLALSSGSAATATINPVAVVTVPAASFESVPVAPDTIVSAFGTQLATQFALANTVPLPTTLGGTTVTVNGRAAGLLFVSSGQINYVLPANTEIGTTNYYEINPRLPKFPLSTATGSPPSQS